VKNERCVEVPLAKALLTKKNAEFLNGQCFAYYYKNARWVVLDRI